MKNILIFCYLILFTLTVSAQSVAVNNDGSAADNSAMLDVKSTTKGLLIPRMTYAERNAIATPVPGLMIYCTNCGGGEIEVYTGLTWTNMVGGPVTQPLAIGDNFGGGKVAYIFQPGDPGYIANQVHGFITTIGDQVNSIQWYNGSFIVTGATATLLNTGNSNTNIIVSAQGPGNYAAKLCSDLSVNGYSDWFLPGRDELNKLYLNRVAIGTFLNTFYWSSSELDLNFAGSQNFTTGAQSFSNKINNYAVRPIRTF